MQRTDMKTNNPIQTPGKIRIGTSNIVVPGNKSTFPERFRLGSRLHYYSSLFNTLEVNSCFYKTPMNATCNKWSLDVPEDFQFSLKLSKGITHVKDLKAEAGCMEKFMKAAEGIGSKKGCILVQFPGMITLDYFEQLERILDELKTLDPNSAWRKAVEFRNDSWHIGETYELLDQYEAVMVLHDKSKGKIMEVNGKPGFIYLRFHGPKGDYRDSYTGSFLKDKAKQIRMWLDEGKDVYAYFNNTIGSAFDNAVTLKNLLK